MELKLHSMDWGKIGAPAFGVCDQHNPINSPASYSSTMHIIVLCILRCFRSCASLPFELKRQKQSQSGCGEETENLLSTSAEAVGRELVLWELEEAGKGQKGKLEMMEGNCRRQPPPPRAEGERQVREGDCLASRGRGRVTAWSFGISTGCEMGSGNIAGQKKRGYCSFA